MRPCFQLTRLSNDSSIVAIGPLRWLSAGRGAFVKSIPIRNVCAPPPLVGSPFPSLGLRILLWVHSPSWVCLYFRALPFQLFHVFFYFVFLLASPAPALRPVLVPFSAGPVGLHYPYIFRVLCSDELPAVHLLFVAGWNLVVASARQL